jgi:hypothetical protein
MKFDEFFSVQGISEFGDFSCLPELPDDRFQILDVIEIIRKMENIILEIT